MTIDELQKELKKISEDEKGKKISLTYLDAEISNKTQILDGLKAEIKAIEETRGSLLETLRTERADSFKEIEDRVWEARKANEFAQAEAQKISAERGQLDQEKADFNLARVDLRDQQRSVEMKISILKETVAKLA